MTTKSDYVLMAKWISDNTTPDPEWSHVRGPLINFVCYIAAESDKLRGNQSGFDKGKFLKAITVYDEGG